MADVVFLALHGSCGEDGRIQATLDLLGVPYTGIRLSGQRHGHGQIRYQADDGLCSGFARLRGTTSTIHGSDIPRLAEELPVPCAVKIVNGGSSIGVELPDTKEQLEKALARAAAPTATTWWWSRRSRAGRSRSPCWATAICPRWRSSPRAPISTMLASIRRAARWSCAPPLSRTRQWKQVGEMALKLHQGLGLSVYSRSDFILDENGQAWCLEINTLPGMTPTSLVPQEAAQVGLNYGELCEKIVELSLAARKAARA